MFRRLTMLGLAVGLTAALAAPASAVTDTWLLSSISLRNDLGATVGTGDLVNTINVQTTTPATPVSTTGNPLLELVALPSPVGGTVSVLNRSTSSGGFGIDSKFDSGVDQINADPDGTGLGVQEFLRIGFANTNWAPVSVWLSHIDKDCIGACDAGDSDDWLIYGSVGPLSSLGPTLLGYGYGDTLNPLSVYIASVSAVAGCLDQCISINFKPTAPGTFQYLYITAADDNAFRVKQVVGEVTSEVPEPGTLLLLGLGLVGLAGAARRKR